MSARRAPNNPQYLGRKPEALALFDAFLVEHGIVLTRRQEAAAFVLLNAPHGAGKTYLLAVMALADPHFDELLSALKVNLGLVDNPVERADR